MLRMMVRMMVRVKALMLKMRRMSKMKMTVDRVSGAAVGLYKCIVT